MCSSNVSCRFQRDKRGSESRNVQDIKSKKWKAGLLWRKLLRGTEGSDLRQRFQSERSLVTWSIILNHSAGSTQRILLFFIQCRSNCSRPKGTCVWITTKPSGMSKRRRWMGRIKDRAVERHKVAPFLQATRIFNGLLIWLLGLFSISALSVFTAAFTCSSDRPRFHIGHWFDWNRCVQVLLVVKL